MDANIEGTERINAASNNNHSTVNATAIVDQTTFRMNEDPAGLNLSDDRSIEDKGIAPVFDDASEHD